MPEWEIIEPLEGPPSDLIPARYVPVEEIEATYGRPHRELLDDGTFVWRLGEHVWEDDDGHPGRLLNG